MRESPSGKASAFQADIRRFESGLPLNLQEEQLDPIHINMI